MPVGSEAKANREKVIGYEPPSYRLPPGCVRDGQGRAVKDPDTRVQEAIDLIFRIFREAYSRRLCGFTATASIFRSTRAGGRTCRSCGSCRPTRLCPTSCTTSVSRLEDVSIEAVAELDDSRMQTAVEKYSIPRSFEDYREMLETVDLDIVYCIITRNG